MVVFDSDGSYILNKTTGELNWLREDNGNYMLDVWIPLHSQLDPHALQKHEVPFHRQP